MICSLPPVLTAPKPIAADVTTKATLKDAVLVLEFETSEGAIRRFVIDSGSPSSFVRQEAFPHLIQGEKLPLLLHGRAVATLTPSLMPIHPLEGAKFDGLLGGDFLRQVILGVDTSTRTAEVWPKTTPIATALSLWRQSHGKDAPLRSIGLGAGPGGLPKVKTAFDTTPLVAFLDTGTSKCILRSGLLPKVRSYRVGWLKVSAWGEDEVNPMVLIPAIRMGVDSSPYPTIVVTPDDDGPDAILGLDFLNDGGWVMDLSGRRLYYGKHPANDDAPVFADGTRFISMRDGVEVRLGDGHSVPPGVYRVKLINGSPVTLVAHVFEKDRPRTDVAAKLERRGRFLKSVRDTGLNLGIAYRGRIVQVAVLSPSKVPTIKPADEDARVGFDAGKVPAGSIVIVGPVGRPVVLPPGGKFPVSPDATVSTLPNGTKVIFLPARPIENGKPDPQPKS